MRTAVLLSCSLLLAVTTAQAQMTSQSPFAPGYSDSVTNAEAHYSARRYQAAGEKYARAFAASGNRGLTSDRYNAACSWAMAGNADSALSQLGRIANARYGDYNHLVIDPDLDALHNDARWAGVVAKVKDNKERGNEGKDKQLIAILDTVIQTDQADRMRLEYTMSKYGQQSGEFKALIKRMNYYDSLNVVKVTAILDHYGWPGTDKIGRQESETIFFVIQHANAVVQDKYLPTVRQAVKDKMLGPDLLAMLEDRLNLAHGRKQVYGSQLIGMGKDAKLSPLEDPENVDKRRAEVGLGPLADYLLQWNIKWDAQAYKSEQTAKDKGKKTGK